MARTPERRQQASLTIFYKIHNNLVTTDKNRHLSAGGSGNRSTRSHPSVSPHPLVSPPECIHVLTEIFLLSQDNCNLQ